MERILFDNEVYLYKEYKFEKELESLVVKNYQQVFGQNTVYIDIKKKIGNDIVTIPDGYMIDFSFNKSPKLYIIENELAIHDPYKHIGTQVLKFAISYKDSGRKIKRFILDFLNHNEERYKFVEKKCSDNGFRNIDAFLEALIYDTPIAAIIIIDQTSDELNKVLNQLTIKTDILEFQTYVATNGKELYKFTPFNEELREIESSPIDADKLDTIVVPAQAEGFQRAFIDANAWWAIRLSSSMIDKIKYIAAYQVAPVSAITHMAEIDRIEKYQDSNKYILYFKAAAKEIRHIKMDKDEKNLSPQSPRYTNHKKIEQARNLKELFNKQ